MAYQVSRWHDFQQYKDRRPTWIKLERSLLDNMNYYALSESTRAALPLLWLLASENKDVKSGNIDLTDEEISFRLRTTVAKLTHNINELVTYGFITVVRNCTEPYETVHREEKRHIEKRREEITRVPLNALTVRHIEKWLTEKRKKGEYLSHNPEKILENFKNYCERSGKKYANYVAAYQNSFAWETNQPRQQPQKSNVRTL